VKKKRSAKSLAQRSDRAFAEFEAQLRKANRPKPDRSVDPRPEPADKPSR
jgi:hypothetical protein